MLDPAALRAAGPEAAAARVATRLESGPGRFWLGLDVDVLDEDQMPATDYLMPGGLDWDELGALLAPLGASPALAGASVQCLNPEKDPGGTLTLRTARLLQAVLGSS